MWELQALVRHGYSSGQPMGWRRVARHKDYMYLINMIPRGQESLFRVAKLNPCEKKQSKRFMEDFSIERLFSILEEKGISAPQLAETTGISSQSIYRWRLHLCRPKVKLVEKIAKALNIEMSELVEGAEARADLGYGTLQMEH